MRCVNGAVQVNLDCEPSFDYGRSTARWKYDGDAYHSAVAHAETIPAQLRLTSDMNLGFEGPRATGRTLIKEGESLFAALSWSEHPAPQTAEEANKRLVWTAHHWQHWLDRGEFPDHPWRSHLQRSALTLKGLSYGPTGALVAAATTSLPETPGGERNWDYRYTWIRDATFMLWGLYTLGFEWEANDFFYFLADVAEAEPDDLQIMYGIGGERELPEQELSHLSGYEGARPVRIGNGAYDQSQHDVWGAILDSFYLHTKSRDYLPERIWPILVKQVERAIERWRQPDRGIWEVRGEPRHFTSSKLMCWVAADRGARLAEIREDLEYAARWQSAAEEIKADICAHALDERGVFCQSYGSTALDASVLLMPLVRFLPADDERIRATVLAIADELTVDDLVLRYRPQDADDGLQGEEGTFTICSFWLVSALVEIGELPRARGPVREAALVREPAAALRRGDRPAHRPPPGQLPAGVHPPRPHQRRHARDPGGGGGAPARPPAPESAVSASRRKRPGRRRADLDVAVGAPRQSQASSAGLATGPPSRPRANEPLRRTTTDPARAATPTAPSARPAAVHRSVSA